MGARGLELGERGAITLTAQKRDAQGKWKGLSNGRGAERWRARCHYRGQDGVMRDITRIGRTRAEAEQALEAAFAEQVGGHVEMTDRTPFVAACRLWLEQIARTDSRLSKRTVFDYTGSFKRYIDVQGSSLRGLNLAEANNPQRLRRLLQEVAEKHGTSSAKVTRSVLSGVLRFAMDNNAVTSNAMRQVGPVEAQAPPPSRRKSAEPRDTERAFTRQERDAIVALADSLAGEEPLHPRTQRKRQAVADMLAFLAGTGVRITEARTLRWEHVNLSRGTADVHGTKSASSTRRLTMPDWLAERMRGRAEATGGTGYVFAAPHFAPETEDRSDREWDQSNCSKALKKVIADAGFPWATPHTFRRAVATLSHQGGAPLVDIADQLGHADPSMTARVYLGRNRMGERKSVAKFL